MYCNAKKVVVGAQKQAQIILEVLPKNWIPSPSHRKTYSLPFTHVNLSSVIVFSTENTVIDSTCLGPELRGDLYEGLFGEITDSNDKKEFIQVLKNEKGVLFIRYEGQCQLVNKHMWDSVRFFEERSAVSVSLDASVGFISLLVPDLSWYMKYTCILKNGAVSELILGALVHNSSRTTILTTDFHVTCQATPHRSERYQATSHDTNQPIVEDGKMEVVTYKFPPGKDYNFPPQTERMYQIAKVDKFTNNTQEFFYDLDQSMNTSTVVWGYTLQTDDHYLVAGPVQLLEETGQYLGTTRIPHTAKRTPFHLVVGVSSDVSVTKTMAGQDNKLGYQLTCRNRKPVPVLFIVMKSMDLGHTPVSPLPCMRTVQEKYEWVYPLEGNETRTFDFIFEDAPRSLFLHPRMPNFPT